MKLHMVGCSHHQASLQLREKIAFTPEQVASALDRWRQRFPESEAALLSTCNRVELYSAVSSQADLPSHSKMIDFVAEFHGIESSLLRSHWLEHSDRAAVTHLFSVAASLDSLVFGETQILSQVKQAYELAQQADSAGPVVHSVFQHASFVAKRVSNETEIHHRRVSVPSVAVSEIATEFFERLDDKQVLVIGSGDMGEETLRYLVDAHARHITLINRSKERADRLAETFGGVSVAWDELDRQLENADLVVSTTGATEPIVRKDRFEAILQRRKKGTILILDLAVPRDFDAAIGDLSDVYLYAMDDLQRICERNVAWREQQWPKAEKIIQEETDRFWANQHHRASVPTIQRLREQADQIKLAELDRLRGRLAHFNVSEQAVTEVEQTIDRVINKILHPPLQSLREESKSDDQASLLAALKRLFQLKD